jgi:hypothetical protein
MLCRGDLVLYSSTDPHYSTDPHIGRLAPGFEFSFAGLHPRPPGYRHCPAPPPEDQIKPGGVEQSTGEASSQRARQARGQLTDPGEPALP